jgi:hypothetical protein
MSTDRKSRPARKAPFLTSLALSCALTIGSAGATIPVADVGNAATHIINQISSYMTQIQAAVEYGTEATREIDRIRNLATQASSLVYSLQTLGMTNPTIRSLNYGMERCSPDFSGFSLSDIFSLIAPSLTSSIPEQQRRICQQIVRLENEKYNEGVRMLQNLQTRSGEISRLRSQLSSSTTSGAVDSNIGQGQTVISQTLADIQYSNAIIKVYESQIESLKQDSRYLAEQALHGKKQGLGESLLSTAVQTASLCAALDVAGDDFSCL